jgi:hypothetical protein
MSFHVISCHFMSFHVVSCHIMSFHVSLDFSPLTFNKVGRVGEGQICFQIYHVQDSISNVQTNLTANSVQKGRSEEIYKSLVNHEQCDFSCICYKSKVVLINFFKIVAVFRSRRKLQRMGERLAPLRATQVEWVRYPARLTTSAEK